MARIGTRVRFAIKDVYFPAPAMVLGKLYGDDVMSGHVVDVSDSGAEADAFMVVKVEGIDEPIVVPVERVREP